MVIENVDMGIKLFYYEYLLAFGENELAELLKQKDYSLINDLSTKYVDYLKK